MRKKKDDNPELVVPKALLERAKGSVEGDKLRRPPKQCVVCSDKVAPNSAEDLCWVCRRLKVSAWHENELQMPVQD